MTFFARFLSICLMPFFFAANVAQADINSNLGPLADAVTLENDGTWETTLRDGWFNMINTSAPDGYLAYNVEQPPLTGGERETSVNVYLQPGGSGMAMAGILLNYLAEDNFMGFVIDKDGHVSAITIKDGTFDKTDADNVRARLDGSDVLKVRETMDQVLFYLNDEEVFNLDQNGGAADFNLHYGIVALGMGRFAFDGFHVTQTGGGSSFPAPGGGGSFPAPGGGTSAPAPIPAPGSGTPAPAPQLSPEQVYQGEVILGTTLGIFFHEFGHALIGETHLPATGPEEDVADEFSAIVLGWIAQGSGSNPALSKVFADTAEYASLFWFYAGVQSMDTDLAQSWQDEHAPGLKRFRNSFCMLYASNPQQYEDLAQKVGFETATEQRCVDDYAKRSAAWNTILSTVQRQQGSTGGGTISVRFEQPSTDTGRAVKALLGDSGDMARVANFLGQMFAWPRDLTIVFKDCQDVNAWYSPDDASITMCYQMTEFASQVIFDGDQQLANGGTGGATTPAPTTPQAGNRALTDAEKFLVGTWTASATQNGVTAQFIAIYADDLSYQAEERYPNITVDTVGTWAADVQTDGSNVITLENTVVDWQPKQICDANNRNCQPFTPEAGRAQITATSQNTVEADGLTWTRQQ